MKSNEKMNVMVTLSKTTFEIVEEAAVRRKMNPNDFLTLIITEWAARNEVIMNSTKKDR